MKTFIKAKLVVLLVWFAMPLPVMSQINVQKVIFPQGADETILKGVVSGRTTIDYTLELDKGQFLQVVLVTKSTSCYFNILPPNSKDVALFIGSTEGNRFAGVAPLDGTYTIRVYLYRSAARRGEKAPFQLKIHKQEP